MPDRRGKHPNARAHQFKPGESGNPAGRPKNIGASVREWLNTMGKWTDAEVKAIIDSEGATREQKIAAHRVMSNEGFDFDRIMDRTEGKPHQYVDMHQEHSGSIVVNIE